MHIKEAQQFLRWEEEQPEFKEQFAALGHAGPQRMQACFGADRSQTHLLGKPDGIVISKFNKGTPHKSKTNAKSADKFVTPRDVASLPGDINTNPIPIPVPPTTPVSYPSPSHYSGVLECERRSEGLPRQKSPGGEWGDFGISPPTAKKDYRKLVFRQQTGYFFGSKFAAGAAWFVANQSHFRHLKFK
jgi:hypothetical protein